MANPSKPNPTHNHPSVRTSILQFFQRHPQAWGGGANYSIKCLNSFFYIHKGRSPLLQEEFRLIINSNCSLLITAAVQTKPIAPLRLPRRKDRHRGIVLLVRLLVVVLHERLQVWEIRNWKQIRPQQPREGIWKRSHLNLANCKLRVLNCLLFNKV